MAWMIPRPLGTTPLKITPLGLGCVTFGREIDEVASLAVLDHALSRGINLLDTAEAYAAGASEKIVGRWLESRGVRREVIVATKVAGSLTPERVLSSAADSLARLRIDQIDLFQVHNFDPQVPLDETLAALNTLVTQGLVAHIGCSNYRADQLEKALDLQQQNGWAPMVSVQPGYSLVEREIEERLIPLCNARQIGVISYSPLAAGFLTGKYRPGGDIPTGTRFDIIPGHQDVYFSEKNFRLVDNLRQIAAAENSTMITLALAWVLGRPGITAVLIGARTPGQIDQALSAADLTLTPDLLSALNNL